MPRGHSLQAPFAREEPPPPTQAPHPSLCPWLWIRAPQPGWAELAGRAVGAVHRQEHPAREDSGASQGQSGAEP